MPEVEKVKEVFKPISGMYDSMNTMMSMGMDIFWRIKLLKLMPKGGYILDVGSGTGRLFDLYRGEARIISLDITLEMLRFNRNLGNKMLGSGVDMPFKDKTFNGIMSAFVLRNLPDTMKYFQEAYRVLKSNGILANLDAFPEERWYIRPWFSIYFYEIMPKLGNSLSSGNSYSYLANSVKNFKRPETIKGEMIEAGFSNVKIIRFHSPSAHLIYGIKL